MGLWCVCRHQRRRALCEDLGSAWPAGDPVLVGPTLPVGPAASRDPEQASRQACVEQSRVQPSQHGCSYSVFGASTLPHPWMALCTGGQGEAKARTGMRTRWSLPTSSIPLPGRWVSFPRSPCGSKHMLWPSGALKPTSLETSFTQKCLINTLPPS